MAFTGQFAVARIQEVLIPLVALTWLATGCNRSDKADTLPESLRSVDHADACDLLSEREASRELGAKATIVPSERHESTCFYAVNGGPDGLLISLTGVSNPREFDVWSENHVELDSVALKESDAATIWQETPNTRFGTARIGSNALKLRITSQRPTSDLGAVQSLLKLAIARLQTRELKFDASGKSEASTCETIPVEDVIDHMGLPGLAAQSGEAGCTFADEVGNVFTVSVAPDAGPEQLDVPPASSVMNGEARQWVVEPADVLGNGARWTVDPFEGSTGELTALFGTRLVKVSISSTNSTSEEIKKRAIQVAELMEPASGAGVAGG